MHKLTSPVRTIPNAQAQAREADDNDALIIKQKIHQDLTIKAWRKATGFTSHEAVVSKQNKARR